MAVVADDILAVQELHMAGEGIETESVCSTCATKNCETYRYIGGCSSELSEGQSSSSDSSPFTALSGTKRGVGDHVQNS